MIREECPDYLAVVDLTKGFGPRPVLQGVSLTVQRGECLVILGDSGCGKTTLLKTLAGFYYPDQGRILLGGKTISRPGWVLYPALRRMSMVFQTSALWPHMTVEENIAFGIKDRKNSRLKVQELAQALKIDNLLKRYPHQISGGQARRVALARAMVAEPYYLLLDEPFTNLDRSVKMEVISYLREFALAQNIGVILVTHQREEAELMEGLVYVMQEGILRREHDDRP